MLSCIYNAQQINPHMNVVLCCCSSATIEDIWWPKTSWTRPWTSLKVSLETDPARVDPDGRTSPCWWPTMTTPPTRCLCSFQVRCDAGVRVTLNVSCVLIWVFCVHQRRWKWASRPLRCTASGCRKKTSLGPLS